MLLFLFHPFLGVQLIDVCNHTDHAEDVDDAEGEDGPEEGTVSKVDGDRLKSYGGPENQVRLD